MWTKKAFVTFQTPWYDRTVLVSVKYEQRTPNVTACYVSSTGAQRLGARETERETHDEKERKEILQRRMEEATHH